MIRIVGTALYQWDTGRYVTTDIEADHVHFSNKGDSKAVIMDLADSQAKIPDYLLQTGKQLCVYVVRNGITVESKVFSVNYRERPENYIYEEDQRNFVYALIADAKAATEAANQAAGAAVEATQSATGSANRATAAAEAAEKASADANKAAEAAAKTAKSLMVVGEARGTAIHLDDAIDQYLVDLRVFGKTTQDGTPTPDAPVDLVSTGDTGSIGVFVAGKNLWDHSNDTGNMSSLSNWGYPIWLNSAVRKTFKPKTTYTMKCKVTCLSIPPYATVYSDQIGFVLHASNNDGYNALMAVDMGNGPLAVGEQRTLQGTFTTQEDVSNIAKGYRILYYTQRYLQENGQAAFARIRVDEVQLEIGETASDYVPYTEQNLNISTPNGLPGIPVTEGGNYTDANGQQWICDEIDFAKGMFVKRVGGVVLNGGEAWSYQSTALYFYLPILGRKPGTNLLCDRLPHARLLSTEFPGWWADDTSNNVFAVAGFVKAGIATTVESFKVYLAENPINLLYILATPIETPLSAEEIAAYAALHTYKDNTTVSNDAGAYMELEYVMDAKKYIDSMITGTMHQATVE